MPTTSVDIPSVLNQHIQTKVEEGQHKSKAEAIRSMICKEMEKKHSVDERLSDETLEKIEQARERGALEGYIRELIEDRL